MSSSHLVLQPNQPKEKRKEIMDDALKAGREGEIDALYHIIEEDPEILDSINKVQFVHTPLHEAAKSGKTHFAIELMSLMPSFARKLNPQGLSPLHLAVIGDENQVGSDLKERKIETAIALVKLDSELVHVKGKGRMTPLHHAVEEDNEQLLAEFLYACPGSIDGLTNKFQTAVHIAVEKKKTKALDILLGWIKRKCREDVLGLGDEKGNTALHIAAEIAQPEVVKKLIHRVNINELNSENLTAYDIAHQKQNDEIKQILHHEGGRPKDSLPELETLPKFLSSKEGPNETLLRRFFSMEKEMNSGMRNVILVVAVLIVTATFQGVLQPPGGYWQGNADNTVQTSSGSNVVKRGGAFNLHDFRKTKLEKHEVGKVVLSSGTFSKFMVGNTIAFLLATVVIYMVLPGRLYTACVHYSLLFLTYSYLSAIQITAESNRSTHALIIFGWSVISLTFLWGLIYFIVKELFSDAWWLPSFFLLSIKYPINKVWQIKKIIQYYHRLKMQHRLSSQDKPVASH